MHSTECRMVARLVAVGVAAVALSAGGAAACDQTSGATREASAAVTASDRAAPAAGAGMKVHRDPDTGEIIPPPPAAAVQSAPRTLRAATGMSERAGMSPAGGVLLDGVPPTSVKAARDLAGEVATHCERTRSGEQE